MFGRHLAAHPSKPFADVGYEGPLHSAFTPILPAPKSTKKISSNKLSKSCCKIKPAVRLKITPSHVLLPARWGYAPNKTEVSAWYLTFPVRAGEPVNGFIKIFSFLLNSAVLTRRYIYLPESEKNAFMAKLDIKGALRLLPVTAADW